MGATMMSETTAAAEGARGALRNDPFAMLPFCGYNMADYFRHWLTTGARATRAPKIFTVNWFRKDADGRFIWPGFGDNIRVMEWIFGRCAGTATGNTTPIGILPRPQNINTAGLALSSTDLERLLEFKGDEWATDIARHAEFLAKFGNRLPAELLAINQKLAAAARS
jgi:phosphoenolpyruvate carboxykinase (GTP)